ncbi:MAG TPA: phage tail tape measure protein [Tissierellia bacterium]|nr:phage tail tape measure protein [Tissierellia bacterium]
MANIDLATYVAKVEVDDSGLKKGLKQSDSLIGKGLNKMELLAKAKIAAITAGIGIGIKKSADEFINFENQMNEVFTLLPGISDSAMKEMEGQVKKLSKEMGILPNDVVPALYQALSAGVPKDNVFEFLEVANKGAIAGVTDTETVVDGLTSVINAYQLEADKAIDVSDIMFQTVKFGKTSFEELSSSLYNVIPTASALGVGFDDVGAALATITKQGTPTAQATVQLRQMFVELSKEGSKTADLFESLAGKSFKEFIAEGNNVQDALKLLEQYANDNNMSVNDLFSSVQAGNGALQLTGESADMFTEALEEMGNASGSTDEAFEQMEQGISRNLDKIKANLKIMMLELGESLAPAIKSFTDWILEIMPTVQLIIEGVLQGIGLAIEGLMDVIGWMVDNTKEAILANNESWQNAKETIMGILDSLKEFILTVVDIIKDIWEEYGEAILENTKIIWGYIADAITNFLGIIKGVIDFFTAFLKGDWEAMGEALETITDNFWELIKNIFKASLKILENLLTLTIGVFKKLGKLIMKGLWSAFKAIWNNITEWFKEVFDKLFEWIKGLGEKFFSTGKEILSKMWDAFKDVWNAIKGWFKSVFNNLIQWILGLGGRFLDAGRELLNKLWQGFKNLWSSIMSWFRNIFSNLIRFLFGKGRDFFNAGRDMFRSLWDGMKSIWTSLKNWVSDKVNWLSDKLFFWRKGQDEMKGGGGKGIPQYAVGTPFVPNDQLAFIHKGEAVIPAKYNPFNPANRNRNQSREPFKTSATSTENHYHIGKLEFPRVQDANEIRRAIEELPNFVEQYANRR